jgi:undecaprenyl-diphosphatase
MLNKVKKVLYKVFIEYFGLIILVLLGIDIASKYIMEAILKYPGSSIELIPGLLDFQLVYNSKGGLYGFVSSHATNAFCIATVFSLISRKRTVVLLLFIWAILTGYSRIYCGVHYPGDVICGALLGVLLGWLVYFLYNKLQNKFPKITL